MDNIIQINRLRYAKMWGERLFHDLLSICPGKSENLEPQRSLRVLLLLCFLFGASPRKLFSKVAVLKFRGKHARWIFVLAAQDVVFGILRQLFLGMSWIDYCAQKQPLEIFYKKLFLKTSKYSQEISKIY